MKDDRRNNVLIALAVLGCLLVGIPTASAKIMPVRPDGIRIGFGPIEEKQFGLDDMFIQFLDAAKTSLDMAFYEVRLDNITDAIIRAHKRGVRVRLVVDNDNYYAKVDPAAGEAEDPEAGQAMISGALMGEVPVSRGAAAAKAELNPFIARLVKAGVPVTDDSGRSGLMHNKFAVRDGTTVWSGSYNLTDTCSYKNPNGFIIIPSKELSDVYVAEFNEMFVDKKFGIGSPKQPHAPVIKVGDVGFEVLFAPEDDPNTRIAQLLAAARTEILFMQFAFTADELGELLIQKKHQGVAVAGIFDRILYRSTGPFGEFSKLTDAGIPVRIYSGEGKFHYKVFIVDANGPDPIVVMGSENASSNGNRGNDENVLIVHSKSIAAAYRTEFQRYEGTFSKVSAQISTGDFPFTGTKIDQVDLMIFGNGVTVDKLSIEFPARWGLASQSVGDVHVIRKGVNTTEKENIRVSERGITIANAGLKGTGADSWLLLRFTDVVLPAVPGKYSMLVSTQSRTGKAEPLMKQPIIWVLDSKNETAFSDLLGFTKNLNLTLQKFGAGLSVNEKADWKKRLVKLNGKANQLVCQAVKDKDDTRVKLALNFLEGLPPDGRKMVATITNGFVDLRQAFQFRLSHDPKDDEAKAQFKRLEDVIATLR
ncbi:MAG: phospholipase D-like domain-containing protein [Candidatus Ozemobacteraceae bacterium]